MAKRMTAPRQIEAMKHLAQQSAAWLLSATPNWLRDRTHEIPRNADGTYDGASLMRWRVSRPVDVTIADGLCEKLLQAAENLAVDLGDGAHAVQGLLIELRDKHGDPGLAEFGRTVLSAINAGSAAEPTEAGILEDLAARLNHDRVWNIRELHVARLEAVHQCDHCDRVRRGSKWLKPGKQYPADAIVSDECPDCSAKAQRRKSRR